MVDERNCRHCGHTIRLATTSDLLDPSSPAYDQRIWKHVGTAPAQVSMLDDQTITPWACKSSVDGRWHPASPVVTIADLADAQRRPEEPGTLVAITTPTDDRPENPWKPVGNTDEGAVEWDGYSQAQGHAWMDYQYGQLHLSASRQTGYRIDPAFLQELQAKNRAAFEEFATATLNLRKHRYMKRMRREKLHRRTRFVGIWALSLGLWFGLWVGIYFLLP